MIRRNFWKQSLHQRAQSVSDPLHETGALSQTHHAQPQRHDSPQTERDRDRGLRAIERTAGYILKPIIPAANCDREQHQREPDVIQHALGSILIRFPRPVDIVVALSIFLSADWLCDE